MAPKKREEVSAGPGISDIMMSLHRNERDRVLVDFYLENTDQISQALIDGIRYIDRSAKFVELSGNLVYIHEDRNEYRPRVHFRMLYSLQGRKGTIIYD
ncbi:MAG: hypothetical protein Q7T51_03255 [Candidatus Moranbacteria bacterium]|nr:hypothetical protein [Candidatus Moranbacteria bacterium]